MLKNVKCEKSKKTSKDIHNIKKCQKRTHVREDVVRHVVHVLAGLSTLTSKLVIDAAFIVVIVIFTVSIVHFFFLAPFLAEAFCVDFEASGGAAPGAPLGSLVGLGAGGRGAGEYRGGGPSI